MLDKPRWSAHFMWNAATSTASPAMPLSVSGSSVRRNTRSDSGTHTSRSTLMKTDRWSGDSGAALPALLPGWSDPASLESSASSSGFFLGVASLAVSRLAARACCGSHAHTRSAYKCTAAEAAFGSLNVLSATLVVPSRISFKVAGADGWAPCTAPHMASAPKRSAAMRPSRPKYELNRREPSWAASERTTRSEAAAEPAALAACSWL